MNNIGDYGKSTQNDVRVKNKKYSLNAPLVFHSSNESAFPVKLSGHLFSHANIYEHTIAIEWLLFLQRDLAFIVYKKNT